MSEDIQVNQQELLISAYLDGELKDEQKAQFADLIEKDEAFQSKVRERQKQHNLLTQAFAQVDASPMPKSVMSMLEQKADVVTLQPKTRHFSPLAMAASVLLVGVLTVFYFGAEKQTGGSDLVAQVNSALDESLSGSLVELGQGKKSQMLVNLSFVDGQNRYCREYFLSQDQSPALHRVSCKGPNGWQTEVEVQSDRILGSDNFRPASGEVSDVIERYLDNNMQSDAFDLDQERQAMEKVWLN